MRKYGIIGITIIILLVGGYVLLFKYKIDPLGINPTATPVSTFEPLKISTTFNFSQTIKNKELINASKLPEILKPLIFNDVAQVSSYKITYDNKSSGFNINYIIQKKKLSEVYNYMTKVTKNWTTVTNKIDSDLGNFTIESNNNEYHVLVIGIQQPSSPNVSIVIKTVKK